jgi:hypothetical protein
MTERSEEHVDDAADRLDEVESKIDKAREHAEEADIISNEQEKRFVDSGDDQATRMDDQTIAPG